MKKTTALFSLLLLLVLVQPTQAQSILTQYAYTLGGASFDRGVDVGLDQAGNAYFIGEFRGTFDFDPGPGTASLTSTQEDVYVVSYDKAGAFRFAFQIGNAFGTSEGAGGIAVDDAGAFYVTGTQPFGTIDYDPDPGTSADRTGKLFIAGYDGNGTFLFALTPGGTSAQAGGTGNAIALDGAGNVYVTGVFMEALDFNPGGAPATLTSEGSTDLFVASYTTSGIYRFAFRLGGTDADEGLGIAADGAGNVYVTGRFRHTVSFDPTDTDGNGDTEDRTAGSGTDLFLASYTATGDFRFVYTLGGGAGDVGYSLATDAADNLYLIGEFSGTVAFDPDDTDGNGDTEERTADADGSAFLASYTAGGAFRFAFVLSEGSSSGRDLVTNASGFSFITGTFGGTVDFDPGVGTAFFSAGTGTDVFVASYSATGAYRGAFTFGGDGLNTGNGIAVDAEGNTTLTGEFTGTTDFDPDPSTIDNRTGAGQNDLFLATYFAGGVLPVELTSFSAVADGGDVLLRWQTASETNNAGFEIHSKSAPADLEKGEDDWQVLAFVEGYGTTSESQQYRYRADVLDVGRYLFRLKQIDFDGTFAYSPEVEVTIGLPGAFSLTAPYPSPFSDQTQFTLAVQQAQQVQVAVHNLLGQRVALLHAGVLQGGEAHRFSIDGRTLPNGVYMIRAVGERFKAERKVVVLK